MRIAYLINQYPKVSHTFIRREIAAVEAAGWTVDRIAIRRSSDALPDPADQEEMHRTRWIVRASFMEILLAVAAACTRPILLARATLLALRMARRAGGGIVKHLAYLTEAMILQRWCRLEGIPHVHAHFGTNATTVAMLCDAMGGPTYSFTVHGPEEFDQPKSLGLEEKIARSAFVAAISSFGKSQLMRWVEPAHWDKIQVVRCGLEAGDLRHEATLPAGNRFACVGRLAVEKGHFILLEACARLAAEKIPFELVVIGGGPLESLLRSRIDQLRLSDCVQMVGYQSGAEVRRWIESSRAAVLPSFAEGLPVVFMEALAMGRPVIASCIAGGPELIQHRVNGWLVPAADVDALVDAMREALGCSSSRLLEMGIAGQASVRMKHDQQIEAGKLCGLFAKHIRRGASDSASVNLSDDSLAVAPAGSV